MVKNVIFFYSYFLIIFKGVEFLRSVIFGRLERSGNGPEITRSKHGMTTLFIICFLRSRRITLILKTGLEFMEVAFLKPEFSGATLFI